MATRTLGFRLEFKGSAETEAALEKVRKKMTDIKAVISKFESTPLTLKTSFDTKEIVEAEKQLVALKEQQKELITQNKAYTKSNKELAEGIPKDSITALYLENRKLLQSLKDLSKEDREGKAGQELTKQINLNKVAINTANEAIGNFQHNVGNYKSAVTGLIPELNNLQQKGILATNDLVNIFKGDLIAKEKQLKQEIAALGQAFKDLGTDITKAGERSAVLGQIHSKAQELAQSTAAINNTGQAVEGLGSKFLKVSDVITGGLIAGGILGLVSSLKAFGSESINEAKQAEIALAKITQQLVVTGNSSGKTAEGLRDTAQQLQVITGLDDDQILNDITSSLLRFGSIQGEVFDRAQKAAIDLAATLGGDLKGAAVIVGKALEDPEKAAGRLAKAGVVLDLQTEKSIALAIKQNDVAKAQGIVLEALEGKFKGVSDAIQDSSLKNLRSFTVFFQNLKEGFGSVLIDTLNTVVTSFRRFNEDATAGTKETKNAIVELNVAYGKEKDFIEKSFEALKDNNIEQGVKKKVIDDLVRQYPEYLNKLDLEKATYEDLSKLENQLSETVKKATFDRILARTREAISAAEDAERIRIAQLKTGDREALDLSTKIKLGAQEAIFRSDRTAARKKAFEDETKLAEVRLQKQIEQGKKVEGQLKADLEKEFGIIDESNQLKKNELGKGLVPQIDLKASKKLYDDLQSQLIRIRQLGEEFAKTEAGLQTNEFQKQIDLATLNAESKIASLKDKIKEIKNKTDEDGNKLGLTAVDKREIAALNKLIDEEGKVKVSLIKKANEDQQKEFDKALVDLKTQQKEVEKIISEISDIQINTKVTDLNFGLSQEQRTIELEYKSNLESLTAQLSQGLITQKEFDDESSKLEINKFSKINKLYEDNKAEYFNLLKLKYDADVKLFEAQKELEKQGLLDSLEAKKSELLDQVNTGKLTPNLANEQLITATIETGEKIKKINIEIANNKKELGQKELEDQQKFSDAEVQANESKNAQIAASDKSAQDEKLGRLIELKDAAIELAGQVASAILDIEKNHSDASFEARKTSLEHEYDNKIKLAKGNTGEIERLEREKDQKIKAIEKQQAERRKQFAIKEAIINTALAIIKALPNLVLAALAALTGGIQIAVIQSQKFAKGGRVKPQAGGYSPDTSYAPDETGYRPVDAVLHEGEHVSTKNQVDKNRMLYEIIERDRIRTNNGQPSVLNEEIIRFAEAKKQALYGQIPDNRIKYTPVIPVIIPLGNSKPSKIEFTDEHIDKIADILSRRISESTGSAVFEGSSQGITNASKESIRQERAALKSQV